MSDGALSFDHPLPLYTTSQFANALGLPLTKLNYWFYALPAKNRYQRFELKRRSGTRTRVIHAPIAPIKQIQRTLATLLKPFYKPPPFVHGYVSARSILTNASVHKRQLWVLRIDLENFFPSINFGRVYGMFKAPPFNYMPDVAALLAQICCHDNVLPHGAPTSPLISNIICRGLDRALSLQARKDYCYYTRYCDDLVFSTSRSVFPQSLAVTDQQTGAVVAGEALREIVEKHGFTVNAAKTVLRYRTQRQLVTGLVANEFPNVPQKYVRSLRNLIYVWEKHGEAAAEASFKKGDRKNRPQAKSMPKFRYVVRGKIQYLGSVKGWHDPVYRRLAKRLAALDTDFKPTTRPSIWPQMLFRVFCEGKTDYTHLRTALQRLRVDGLYPEIDLDFQIHHAKGDNDLLKRCEHLAGTPQAVSCVFIFDRDSARVVERVEDAGPYKNWGNRVYSFALPVPPHRDPSLPLCVELLYEDSILKTADSEGRRVFARSEFNLSTGAHATNNDVYCLHPNSESVILEKVIDFATKKNVALSKSAFSNLVAAGEKPFDAVDFGGFVPVFQVFQRIREQILHDV